MLRIAFAIAALALVLAIIVPTLVDVPADPAPAPPPVTEPAPPIYDRFGELTVDRAPDGHFYTEGQVNGARVRFMIDTGASRVVLRRQDAQSAGIMVSGDGFTATARTAGGDIALQPVTIERLSVGGNEARGVAAMVVEGELPVSLLGQSWLRQMGTLTIADDRMTLR